MKVSRGNKEQMREEMLDLSQENLKKIENSFEELTKKTLEQGFSPKDAMGLDNKILEGIYAQAYRLYNTGKYDEAIHLFRMLLLFNPSEPKYVLGVAACFHMMKEYKNAIQSYTMCSMLDPENPVPHYHASDCYIQLNDPISAMICLEMVLKRTQNKPEFEKMKERASLTLESLKKEQKKS